MPKTATGKIQRRQVAKTMIEEEKKEEEKKHSLDSSLELPKISVDRKGFRFSSLFPKWFVSFVTRIFQWQK